MKEEKRREEEILKAQALARQIKKSRKNKQTKSPVPSKLLNKLKSVSNNTTLKTLDDSKGKAKNNNNKAKPQISNSNSELMEETIPAMVTIKRVVENNNSPPTVTITLKGSTPDQDKLLYTLVNGHASDYTAIGRDKVNNSIKKPKSQEQSVKISETNADIKKKKKKSPNSIINPPNVPVNTVTTKELKVTLAVDKSFHKGKETFEMMKKEKSNNQKNKNKNFPKSSDDNKFATKSPIESMKDLEIDIPSLKLPPGT